MRRIPTFLRRSHYRLVRPANQVLHVRTFFPFSKSDEEKKREEERGINDELSLEEVKALVEMEEEQEEIRQQDEDEEKPWHILLEPAARAAWRTSDQTPPLYWMEQREKVLSQSARTSKQLKRNHQQILITQQALQERRERERKRQKDYTKKPKADSLLEKYGKEKDAAATSVFYKPDFTLATLKHRLLPNYAITKRVLLEMQALLPNFQPKRVLDFGMGVGSSSAAAMDVFDRDSIEWIHGIDPSKSMRECSEKILDSTSGIPRITTDASLTTKSARGTFDLVLFTFTATEMPHMASTMAAAAVLWEKLAPNGVLVMIEPGTPDGFSNIRSVRSMLLDCCPPDVDPDDEDEDDEYHGLLDQCHIIAPCTHNGECPMERHRKILRPLVDGVEEYEEEHEESASEEEAQDAEWTEESSRMGGISQTGSFDGAFCSFVHSIPGSPNSHKGDKLSYLVAQKRYADTADGIPPVIFPNLTKLLAETYRSVNDRDPINHEIMLYEAVQALDKFEELEDDDPLGLSIVVGDANRQSFGRIIRAPLKRKGHILVDYCTGPSPNGSENAVEGEEDKDANKGRIVRHRIGKTSSGKIAPGHYTAARKARWGGFWPDIMDQVH